MVKDKKLLNVFGDTILDWGFTSLPNRILWMQKDLGLTDRELLFFIKCYSMNKCVVKDSELGIDSSHATISRIRKSLIEKGYLKSNVIISRIEDGTFRTNGISYDWSGLIQRVKSITLSTIELNCDSGLNQPTYQNELPESKNEVSSSSSQNYTPSLKESLKEVAEEASNTYSNVVLDNTNDVTTYHAVKTGTTTAALRENAEERANANDATVSNGQSMQEPPPLTAAPPPITNDPEKRRYIYFCELYEKTYCRTLNSIEQRTAEKYLRFRKPSKKLMHEAIKAKNRIDWIIDYMGRKDKDDMANTPANLKEHSK